MNSATEGARCEEDLPMWRWFDHIYIINLPHRTDRRADMGKALARMGLDPRSARITWFAAERPQEAAGFESVGARGCFLSHLGVLDDAAMRGWRRVLVLEDDADFAADAAQRWPRVQAALDQSEWQILWAGLDLPESAMPSGADAMQRIPPDLMALLMHCMVYQAPVMAQFAAYLRAMLTRPAGDPDGGPMHVDGALGWFRRAHPEVQTWAPYPPLCGQRASRTDIHALRWWDRIPGARQVAGGLRRLKNGQRERRSRPRHGASG